VTAPSDVVALTDAADVPALLDDDQLRDQVGQLTITPRQRKLTPLQLSAFTAICNFDPRDEPASWPYINVWLQVCSELRLSPWSRMIYLYARGEPGPYRRYVVQTSIHGLTALAQRTGRFVKWVTTVYTSDEDTPDWWRDVVDPETELVTRDRVWVSSWIWPNKHPAVARVYLKYRDASGAEQITFADAHWHTFAPYRQKYAGDRGARTKVLDPETLMPVMDLPRMWKQDGGAFMLGKCARAFVLRNTFPAECSGVYVEEELQAGDVAAELQMESDRRAARRQVLVDAQKAADPDTVHADPARTPAGAAAAVDGRVNGAVHGGVNGVHAQPPGTVHTGPGTGGGQGVNGGTRDSSGVHVSAEQRRAWLLEEVTAVSGIIGKDVTVPITRRLGAPMEEIDTDVLASMVGSFRASVAVRLRDGGDHTAAAAYAAIPPGVCAPAHVLFGRDPAPVRDEACTLPPRPGGGPVAGWPCTPDAVAAFTVCTAS
jgi:hypothetical protein